MPKANTHDPFAPPVPAFPRALLERSLPADQVSHLEARYDEQSHEDAAEWLTQVQGLDTDGVASLYALPDLPVAELAKLPRAQLVNLSAARGLPTSPNRDELAAALDAYEPPQDDADEADEDEETTEGENDGESEADGDGAPRQEETPGDSGATTTADGPIVDGALVGTVTPPAPVNP